MFVATYFFVQAAAIVAWWAALAMWPASRPWFLPGTTIEPAFAAFAAADLLILAPLSFAAAWLALTGRPLASAAAWMTAGAICYSAAYTVAWALLVGAPVLSPVAMIAAALGSALCAHRRV